MDGDRYNPPGSVIMIISIIIMYTTLRPILIPPPHLNATNPKPEAEFRVVIQVATRSFWLFCHLAFAFALAAAGLVHVGKHSRVSVNLLIIALLCLWVSLNCAFVVNYNLL
ncbi:hypothetical protein AALP_AA1G239900 [Arabis alpina]|uniref:Uncharacterized protein n=1 Tax=Arabis alpina TaxID=50452 RepID=A0A087HQ97_ARAAL|nr:hypothetical protein AALP_AA1G239900 [Arabis alpina]